MMGALRRKTEDGWAPVVTVSRVDVGAPQPESPAAPTQSPWAPLITSRNTIPTYDGSGATIHPSVYDLGEPWNGYRWWMGNTPYPDGRVDLENPCIWGSNDRINWTEPAPGVNPIDGDPSSPEYPEGFYSDTELEYEPTTGTMWLFWRFAPSMPADFINLHAASSTDGVTWNDHGAIHTFTAAPWASPAVVRVAADDWRMFTMSGSASTRRWTATSPLGPWTYVGTCTLAGGGQFRQYHGDIIYHDGLWWAVYSNGGFGYLASSTDSVTWTENPANLLRGGFITYIYRPTMLPSVEPGHMDVWTSGYHDASPGGNVTAYTRIPATEWTDLT